MIYQLYKAKPPYPVSAAVWLSKVAVMLNLLHGTQPVAKLVKAALWVDGDRSVRFTREFFEALAALAPFEIKIGQEAAKVNKPSLYWTRNW